MSYCVERQCHCLSPFPIENARYPVPISPDVLSREFQSKLSCGPILYFEESFEMMGIADSKADRAMGSERIPQLNESSQMMPRVASRARTPRTNAFSTTNIIMVIILN